MIKKIITPESAQIQLDIPEEYVGREIEVTFVLVDEPGSANAYSSDNSDLAAKIVQEQLRKEREGGFDRSGPGKIF